MKDVSGSQQLKNSRNCLCITRFSNQVIREELLDEQRQACDLEVGLKSIFQIKESHSRVHILLALFLLWQYQLDDQLVFLELVADRKLRSLAQLLGNAF